MGEEYQQQPTGEEQQTVEGNQQVPQATQGDEGRQEQVPSSPEEPVYEIDGQKYTLTEIKRWRDTRPNLEKYYYTKMNELAQREKELQNAAALYDYLRQRPEVAQRLLEFVNQGGELPTQMQGETTDEYLARLEKIEQQLQGMQNKFQQDEARRLQKEADEALAAEIKRLKEKYGNDKILPFDEEQVLLEAYNSGMMDLERVYKQLRHDAIDIEKLKQQAIQEYLSQKKSSQTPRMPATSGGGGIPASGGQPPKTFLEAKRSALQRLLGRREGE